MPRGGKRPGAGRPRISDADRLEIAKQATEIILRYEKMRALDLNDIGSANKRKMRRYDKEINKFRDEEKMHLAYVQAHYPEEEHLPRMLKYRRELSHGDHKDDVEMALWEDQGIGDVSLKPGRTLSTSGQLPRRYGKRKKFLEDAARELNESGQFPYNIGMRLVESSISAFRSLLYVNQELTSINATLITSEWSEPTQRNDSEDDDGVASNLGIWLASHH